MTCAGISSLIIAGSRRYEGLEFLQGEAIRDCGRGGVNRPLLRAIDWLASHFQVGQNIGHGQIWKYYYLYGMERAGRLAGVRFFGQNDWYRQGAEELVHDQQPALGLLARGRPGERAGRDELRAAVPRQGPRAGADQQADATSPLGDWNNDPDDVRNLVGLVVARLEEPADLADRGPRQRHGAGPAPGADPVLQRPSRAGVLRQRRRQNIREYVEQGGFLFADACCGDPEFDRGFRRLIEEIFPPPEFQLRPLPPEHPVWRARHLLSPEVHPLLGHRARLPDRGDLLAPGPLVLLEPVGAQPRRIPAVIRAVKIGQNVVDYATGREMPADKLVAREVHDFNSPAAQAGRTADRQAEARRRLEHRPAGDPQPDGRPPQAAIQLQRRAQPEGPVPPRPQPDLLPADLHPRPRRPVVPQGGPRAPCAATSSPAAARSSPTRPAAARPSTPPSAASSPSCCPTTASSRSPATTSCTPRRSAST